MNTSSLVESLEPRIAPAGLFTFTDVDGDLVTVKSSKGNNDQLQAALSRASSGSGEQLQAVNLSANPAVFAGTSLSVTATRGPTGGDGFVNVGHVNATGLDLAKVVIDGDLGKITIGNAASAKAFTALDVQSMGRFGTSTQAGTPNLVSTITGTAGAILIRGDLDDAALSATGNVDSLKIGGSVLAGSFSVSGTGNLGSLVVGGDIAGGNAARSGLIDIGGDLGKASIGGSIAGVILAAGSGGAGGSNDPISGAVRIGGDLLGTATIGGSIIGGSRADSGVFEVGGAAKKIVVGGNITGNAANSGLVKVGGNLGSAIVGGNITGNDENSGRLAEEQPEVVDPDEEPPVGAVFGPTSVSIKGSVLGGSGDSSGTIDLSGTSRVSIGGDVRGGDGASSGKISIDGDLTRLSVKGSIIGGDASLSGNFSATGNLLGTASIGGSIIGGNNTESGNLYIQGSAKKILLGGDLKGGTGVAAGGVAVAGRLAEIAVGGSIIGVIADAPLQGGNAGLFGSSIGSVRVGGSVLGASDQTAQISALGNIGSVLIKGDLRGGSGPDSGLISSLEGSIGSINIGGSVAGGSGKNSGSIRADEAIGSIKVGGFVAGRSPANPVFITAGADGNAIGSLTAGGRMEHTLVLAGYDTSSTPIAVNGGSSIGRVFVGSDCIASSIVAGARNTGFPNFGTSQDAAIADTSVLSRIASIVVKGHAMGTVGGVDRFGFVAEQIGSVTIGSAMQSIPSPGGFTPVGTTFSGTDRDLNIHVVVPA